MADLKPAKKRESRKNDPDYCLNPRSGRYIKKSSRLYKQIITDAVANLDPAERKNNVIATGTDEELIMIRDKLKNSKLIADHNTLDIRNGKLQTIRKTLKRGKMQDQTKNTVMEAVLANRALIKKDGLTEAQVSMLLCKICDAKILGKVIDVSAEVDLLLELSKPRFDDPPPPKLKLKRQNGYYKSKFRVKKRPVTEDETTAVENDSDASLSDSGSE